MDKNNAFGTPVEGQVGTDQPMDVDEFWEKNSSVVNNEDPGGRAEESVTAEAISCLENMALSFLSQLTGSLEPSNPDASEANGRRITLELASRKNTPGSQKDATPRLRSLQFPRKSKGSSARTPAQLLRVVSIAHEALVSQTPMTKRDLYYRDVSLFSKQGVADTVSAWKSGDDKLSIRLTLRKLVDDLAATFSLSRSDLNIRASSKGLYCGAALTICLSDGTSLVGRETESILIPCSQEISEIKTSKDLAWVLIVEKDAVFQTLRSAGLTTHPSLHGSGLLVTGKGYPDLATRQLTKALSDNLPEKTPILALVDADAYGLDIVSVYKYGSVSMRHESESLAAERVQWIGISTSEILDLGINRDDLLPISSHDQRKAYTLLKSKPDLPAIWKRELMQLIHNRRKAEIEILSSLTSSLKPRNWEKYPEDNSFPSLQQNPLVYYVLHKIKSHLSSISLEESS